MYFYLEPVITGQHQIYLKVLFTIYHFRESFGYFLIALIKHFHWKHSDNYGGSFQASFIRWLIMHTNIFIQISTMYIAMYINIHTWFIYINIHTWFRFPCWHSEIELNNYVWMCDMTENRISFSFANFYLILFDSRKAWNTSIFVDLGKKLCLKIS